MEVDRISHVAMPQALRIVDLLGQSLFKITGRTKDAGNR